MKQKELLNFKMTEAEIEAAKKKKKLKWKQKS